MEDPRWLRLVTIGLVLAALAVGYFLLSGKLTSNNATRTNTQVNKAVATATPAAIQTPKPTPTPTLILTPTPTPMSAYNTIANRTKGGQTTQTLPSTGFPVGLIGVFSISAVIAGWSLRKFPH